MSTDVYGIDFSGSKSPGQKIWLTTASLTAGPKSRLEVHSVESAADRFEAIHRDEILPKLRAFIRGTGNAVIGIDFPFGFPRSSVEDSGWVEFLNSFATTFEGEDIDAFPGRYGERGRLKRDIDFRFGGQSPMSPQVQYQVFYGLRDVIYPLVRKDAVRVVPMQSRDLTKPTLLEVYPAATLGAERLYRTGYKATSEEAQNRRRANIRKLNESERVAIDEDAVAKAIKSDDALDSVCAAFAVQRAMHEGLERDDVGVEGYIYA